MIFSLGSKSGQGSTMHYLVLFFMIFGFLQCLNYCQGHFNTQQSSENAGKGSFEKHRHIVSMVDNDIAVVEFPREVLRTRRQNMGVRGNPEAFSYNVTEDDILDYGIIIYSGEGSKVSYLSIIV